jgi:hypothetical protein
MSTLEPHTLAQGDACVQPVAAGASANRVLASVSHAEHQTTGMDEEEKYALGVLLLDEGDSAASTHHVLADTSLSSDASVRCAPAETTAFMSRARARPRRR